MDKPCSNCGRLIAEVGHLTRVNAKGVLGIWSCPSCLKFDDDEIERCDGKVIYVHALNCPSFCDFACNDEWGKQLAEYVNLREATVQLESQDGSPKI